MPDAVLVTIADEVVSFLTDATLSQEITPQRSYADWADDLQKPTDLLVDVVAHMTEQTAEQVSTDAMRYIVPVDIAVRKRFHQESLNEDTGRVELAEVDALVYLVQEIHELFFPALAEAFTSAALQERKIIVNPHRQHLRDIKQFTGVVRLVFWHHKKMTA